MRRHDQGGPPVSAAGGHGTGHPGVGRCSRHCGATPTGEVNGRRLLEARAEEQALALYQRYSGNGDRPADVLAELADLLAMVTSFTRFATARIERLGADEWAAFDPRTAAEVGMFERACDRAGKLLTRTVQLGLDSERIHFFRVRAAQADADEILWRFQGILAELDLTPGQEAALGEVVPRWMRKPMPPGARLAPYVPPRLPRQPGGVGGAA